MFNRVWRIILLIIALIFVIWPTLLFAGFNWIGLIAIVILLIGEFWGRNCNCGKSMAMNTKKMPARKAARRTARRKRRR